MKKMHLFLMLILPFLVHAQDEPPPTVNVFKATLLDPGISYEQHLGQRSTLVGRLYLFASFSGVISDDFVDYNFYLGPALDLQYRFYYNLFSRQQKGKRIDLNSANYVSALYNGVYSDMPVTEDNLQSSSPRMINRVGIVWGIQRNYKNRFSLDLNVGLGYLMTQSPQFDYNGNIVEKHYDEATILGQLTLGIWLNKKK